jgi:hypothetical protein
MKGPPKMKGMGGPKGMPKMGSGKPGIVTGGNTSGLSAGLDAARPVKPGRMASMKKQMFGGGM